MALFDPHDWANAASGVTALSPPVEPVPVSIPPGLRSTFAEDDLRAQFLAFCRSKPADETFDAEDGKSCAGYQFLKAAGYPVSDFLAYHWFDTDNELHDVPRGVGEAIEWAFRAAQAGRSVTFGALAERLSA